MNNPELEKLKIAAQQPATTMEVFVMSSFCMVVLGLFILFLSLISGCHEVIDGKDIEHYCDCGYYGP